LDPVMEKTSFDASDDAPVTGAGAALVIDAPGGSDAPVDTDPRRAELMATIEAIRPALQADGGDMELVNVDTRTGRVDIELIGACGTCPASTMTLKAGIERILGDRVPWVTQVVAVGIDEPVDPGLGDIPGFGDW
jgi:Fe-S cluster biogenesis protein NfuA